MGKKRPRKESPAASSPALLSGAILFLFFVSGSLGLIYQVVWLRMLILIFGSNHFAVATVLTAFMAGLAVGAYVLGRQIDRRWNPLVVYGLFEIGIGLFALLIPWIFGLLEPLSRWLWSAFSPTFYTFSLLRFLFVGAVLIIPTSLMGGTLPALSRFVTRRTERMGLSVGSLYGVNTFGAVAGTAATGFLLVPSLGVQKTIWLAAALNVAVGAVSLVIYAGSRRGAGEKAPAPEARSEPSGQEKRAPLPSHVKMVLAAFAVSGFIAMIYEIAWTRVLALVIGSSVYAFTIMLTTFLVGLAAGASLMSGIADRIGARRGVEGVSVLLAGTGVTAFVTLALLHNLPYWFSLAFHASYADDPSVERRGLLFAIHFLMAGVVMLPPTLFLGGMFPLVVKTCGSAMRKVGRTVGTAYAANTVGTIFGSALGGFLVVPVLGIQGSIMAAIVVDLILAALLLVLPAARQEPGPAGRARMAVAGGCAVLGIAFWILQPSWNVLLMNSGMHVYVTGLGEGDLEKKAFERTATRDREILYYKEGVTATVMVARELGEKENIYLSLDGKVDASSHGDTETQLLVGHVPMLYAGDRDDVVVVGYATGMTVGAAAMHTERSLTAVEIEGAVIEASRYFSEYNNDPLSNDKVKIVVGDGRNFLLVTPDHYDVIISEPPNPWMTIAANLFTTEYFKMGKERLKPGGIFCGWVQLYGLPPDLVRTVIRTFADVFPHVSIYMPIPFADLILLGSERPLTPDLDLLERRLADPEVARDLGRIGIHSAYDLLSYHIMGDEEVRAFAGHGVHNTDDNAYIEFNAPKALYQGTRMSNAQALVPFLSDPLAGARGLGDTPQERAEAYDRLAEAFFRRQVAGRAFNAFQRAQELDPTEERARREQEVRDWFQQELTRRQQGRTGG